MERAFRETGLRDTGISLPNVFIKAATFEGMYDGGLPTQALTDHHVRLAEGGVGMSTVSYGAVSADGRTFKEQMYIHERSLAGLEKLTKSVHDAGGKISIQLTHCGYFTKNKSTGKLVAPSRVLNEYGVLAGLMFSKAMNAADMEQVAADFALAAVGVKKAGFDAIELHMGHGYLLSQFLSPATNHRKDEYGGSIQNRSRFPLKVLKRVIDSVGDNFPVLVKLNLSDGLKKGFSGEDCLYVAGEIEKTSCAAIVLSGGFTSKTPFYLMRGDVPLRGMIRNGSSLAEKLTMSLFGPLIIKKYPFEENFFLRQALEVRKAVKMPLSYLGGVDSKEGIVEILDAGFEFISIGRALIHDPDFLLKIKSGEIERTECNRCNECVVEMDRNGVRCTLND